MTFSSVYSLGGKSMISPLHSFQLKHLRGSPHSEHSEHTTTRPGASAGQLLITRWRYGNCQFWVMACLVHTVNIRQKSVAFIKIQDCWWGDCRPLKDVQ